MNNNLWLNSWTNGVFNTWWDTNTWVDTWLHYVGNDAIETLNNINSWQSNTKKQYYDAKNQEIANQAQNMFECSVRTDDWQVKKMNMSWANLNNMALLIKQASNAQWYHSYDDLNPDAALCRFLQKNPHHFQLTQDALDGTISLDDWAYETGIVNPLSWESYWPTTTNSYRSLKFNSDVWVRGNLTPQTNEWNDNLIPYYDPIKWDEMSWFWGTAWGIWLNLAWSIYNLAASLVDMAINPIDTATTAFKIWVWALQNITWEDDKLEDILWYTWNEDLLKFYTEANEMADWLWDVLVDRYWWRDENWNLNDFGWGVVNFLEHLAEDPAGMISDVASWLAGWAWLARRWVQLSSKFVKNTSAINNLNKVSNWLETVRKYSNAADPMNIVTSPKEAWNQSKNVTNKLLENAKDTEIWKNVSKVVWNIKDSVMKSEKMKSFKNLASTKLGKLILPEASEIYKKLAPMDRSQISKFEANFGVKYGDYLNEKWIKWTPQEIIDQLQYENDRLFNEVSQWFEKIEEPIKVSWEDKAYVESMLQHNILHLKNTYPEKVFYKRPELEEMVNALKRVQDTWEISWMDYLFNKRYFERKTKFSYWKRKDIAPERVELATNIDNAIREIWLKYADEHWFDNLKTINDQIRKNRAIIDWMWEKAIKEAWYTNGIQLSDVILAASARDPSVLWMKAFLGFISSKPIKEIQLKLWNFMRWIKKWEFSSVDMDEIWRVNAENRINNFYNMSMWDGTPRLNDNYQWGVAATDNSDWINARASDLPKLTDLVIETYTKTPRDVEKNVVDFVPINDKVKGEINWEQRWQWSVFDTTIN